MREIHYLHLILNPSVFQCDTHKAETLRNELVIKNAPYSSANKYILLRGCPCVFDVSLYNSGTM